MQFSKFSYNSQKLKINEKMMSMPRHMGKGNGYSIRRKKPRVKELQSITEVVQVLVVIKKKA